MATVVLILGTIKSTTSYHFGPTLGGFFKVLTQMRCNSNQIFMLRFLMQSKYSQKLNQKSTFLDHSKRVFVYVVLYSLSLAFNICQMRVLHNRYNFNQYSICSCKSPSMRDFLKVFFWVFTSPKYSPILLKLASEI